MIERGFVESSSVPSDISTSDWLVLNCPCPIIRYSSVRWVHQTVGQLPQRTPLTVLPDVTVSTAVEILKREGFDQIPVVNHDG